MGIVNLTLDSFSGERPAPVDTRQFALMREALLRSCALGFSVLVGWSLKSTLCTITGWPVG